MIKYYYLVLGLAQPTFDSRYIIDAQGVSARISTDTRIYG
jgi:hypothetical protein